MLKRTKVLKEGSPSPKELQDFEYDSVEPLCKATRKAGLTGDKMKKACNQAYHKLIGSGFKADLYAFSESKKLKEGFDFSDCSSEKEVADTFTNYFVQEVEDTFGTLDISDYKTIGRLLINVNDSLAKREGYKMISKRRVQEGRFEGVGFIKITPAIVNEAMEAGLDLSGYEGNYITTDDYDVFGDSKYAKQLTYWVASRRGDVDVVCIDPHFTSVENVVNILNFSEKVSKETRKAFKESLDPYLAKEVKSWGNEDALNEEPPLPQRTIIDQLSEVAGEPVGPEYYTIYMDAYNSAC